MTCFEAIQAIMMQSNPDSLMSATSSFLHVRAELWDYAHEKVGVLLIMTFQAFHGYKTNFIL